MMPTTSSPVVSSSSTTGTAGMCYMINGRRMTKAEKREMKHKLKLEAHSVRRVARAQDVEKRIRKERAAKAEQRQQRRADEKRRQRVQQCDETTKFKSSHLLLPSAATELIGDIVMNSDDDNKDEKKGSSTTYLANASTNIDATSNFNEEYLAPYVADMSPTCAYVAKSWPTLRVVATQKRPRYTQFISIITDKYKSAQTYGYLSYHRVFVFELKQQSRNYRHVGNPPTCHQMSCCFGHPANTTFSCFCDMTETCRRMSPFGQQNDTPTSDIWS